MIGEPTAGLADLTLLALRARVGALVVAAEQKDEPVAVSVAEHTQQDALAPRFVTCRLAERPQNLARIVAQSKLEETVAELPAVGAAADADAFLLEDLCHRDADRSSLRRRQFLAEPTQDRLVAGGIGVELEGESRQGSQRRSGVPSQSAALSRRRWHGVDRSFDDGSLVVGDEQRDIIGRFGSAATIRCSAARASTSSVNESMRLPPLLTSE